MTKYYKNVTDMLSLYNIILHLLTVNFTYDNMQKNDKGEKIWRRIEKNIA